MHFFDYTIIFAMALILFGPKKLPEMARQLGKLMAEFRRASNEFKAQIDEELRSADQAERQKQISATTVAALEGQASEPRIMPPSLGAPVSQGESSGEAPPISSNGPERDREHDGPSNWPSGEADAIPPASDACSEPVPLHSTLFKDAQPTFGAPYSVEVSAHASHESNGVASALASDGASIDGTAAENAQASMSHAVADHV